jgi:hypothetical protein
MTRSPVDAEVIADRYLTSPIGVRARPYGPVEALDTHSDRAAQVRIVFVPGEWGEGELADAVAGWCGIGCAEITGVLDFGRHGDRWFLVLPPSLGMPVARWRSLRRPTSADAARLVLAFGRLVERVGAAGFPPDTAELADFAVGPGPTPFLERPLLGPPRPHGVAPPDGDGQRTLAALFRTIVDPARSTPPALGAWAATAAAAGFGSLAACLDELQRAGSVAQAERGDADDEPLGLAGIFDDDVPTVRARRRGLPVAVRRMGAVAGAVAAVAAAVMALGAPRAPDPATEAPAAAAPARALTVPVDVLGPPVTVDDRPRGPARSKGRDGRGERERHPARPRGGDRAGPPSRAPTRRDAAPSTTQLPGDTGSAASPASPTPAPTGAPGDRGEQPAPAPPAPPPDPPPHRDEPPGLPPPGGTIELPAP